MIRLTLNAQSDPEIHLFNKSTILIGSEPSLTDLVLQGADIQPLHLKITEKEGVFHLTNTANDPFVSLNGNPLGKKKLASSDVIELHQTTILFEILPAQPEDLLSAEREKSNGLEPLVGSAAGKDNTPSPFVFPFENEVEALDEEELRQASFDNYAYNSSAQDEEIRINPPPIEKETSKPLAPKKSLKDDYLRDLDDDNANNQAFFGEQQEPSHLYQAWKWILVFMFSFFAFTGLVGTVIYFTLSDKSEAQETRAAQGVADVAMALAHAQLHHLKPHSNNWSDADFIKSNLLAILPDTPSYASQIDAQGQFHCCPYSLRIYMSSDLSHYLLIAQPAPGLLNWLIPPSLIVVDSHLMELRILKDVRGLNRLLAHPDPLDGVNGKEISSLIKREGIIRLAHLATESGNQDFAPPKNLAWLKSGSDNLIYNAPRYYRLGQHILQKSILLSTSKGTSQEVTELKQEIDNLFSILHQFVFYSDQGKKTATIAKQGVTLFAQSDKLLFGYLLFNAQGKIQQVHLIKDEDEIASHLSIVNPKSEEIAALITPVEMAQSNDKTSSLDLNHPIYIQLQFLVAAREGEIKPLVDALSHLVNQDLIHPRAQFQSEYDELSHKYSMANAKHKQAIKEALDALYHQYEDYPIDQFLAFIKALKLEHLIRQENQSFAVVDENCQQNMELLLTYIDNTKSIVELDNLIHIANSWLSFDYVKDPAELMKYQTHLRNRLLDQLERYLLSEKKYKFVKIDDKKALHHLLSQERLISQEEKDFFLAEFDEIFTSDQ